MEPPPFKASSDEDREEWIRRLDGDLLDAFARVTTLRAQHEALPGLSLKEIEDPALTFEERLVLIDRELERFDKVLPIIDQLEQAEKDMRDALVGLKRAMPEE